MTSTPPGSESYFSGDGGARLFLKSVAGPGLPVVVVHGGPGCDSAYLEPDLAPLAERHAVVYYDQRGSGRSELPSHRTLLTIEHHVRDLERLRRHLSIDALTLLGHSFGSLLAARYAIADPARVRRMVFIGPLPPRQGDLWGRFHATIDSRLPRAERERMEGYWRDLIEGRDPVGACRRFWSIALKPRLADPARTDLIQGDFCAASPEAIRYGMSVTNAETMASLGDWDLRSDLAVVTAPTLVLHGEQEANPIDLVEEWTTALPDCRLIRVPGAAHFPHVERPELVWPVIERFLGASPVGES